MPNSSTLILWCLESQYWWLSRTGGNAYVEKWKEAARKHSLATTEIHFATVSAKQRIVSNEYALRLHLQFGKWKFRCPLYSLLRRSNSAYIEIDKRTFPNIHLRSNSARYRRIGESHNLIHLPWNSQECKEWCVKPFPSNLQEFKTIQSGRMRQPQAPKHLITRIQKECKELLSDNRRVQDNKRSPIMAIRGLVDDACVAIQIPSLSSTTATTITTTAARGGCGLTRRGIRLMVPNPPVRGTPPMNSCVHMLLLLLLAAPITSRCTWVCAT